MQQIKKQIWFKQAWFSTETLVQNEDICTKLKHFDYCLEYLTMLFKQKGFSFSIMY